MIKSEEENDKLLVVVEDFDRNDSQSSRPAAKINLFH